MCDDIKERRLIGLLADHTPNDIEVIRALYINAAHVPVRVRAFIDHMIEQLPTMASLLSAGSIRTG